jgi:hypothetical protein
LVPTTKLFVRTTNWRSSIWEGAVNNDLIISRMSNENSYCYIGLGN